MSDGALRISILGDASQFKETLADLQKRLEKFKEDLKTATGLDVPRINFEINGIETSIKQITEFGKFAEGSLGFYKQLKRELEDQLNVTTNRAEQEQLVKRLSDVSNIIKDIKSAGIEKPIPVAIVIEPPPPGSIADIKNKISEILKEKQIAVGVNLTNANVKLQGLKKELSVLENQGIEIEAKPITPVLENSIQGIKNRIDELNAKKVLIDIDDKVGLATINKEIGDLTGQLTKANSVSFDKNGKITENANKANRALTSLSLIAQDLPFGFIAIQNNLPAVFETFGQLRSQSDGVKGVLQTLGASLVGPAGLFLAFSVVTGAVTYAIKEYGSLSNAVKVLTGANSDAIKSQVALNKALTEESGNIGGRIAQIKILVDNLNKETVSQAEKLAIYRALRDISPDLVAGVDELNYATSQSTLLINNNAKAYINLLNIQVKQKSILKVLDELEQKRFAANGKYNAARAKQIELEEKLAKIDAKKSSGQALTAQERTLDRQRKLLINEAGVGEARDAIASITAEQDKWYNSLKPLVTETSNADSAFETFRKTLEEFRKAQKAAAKGTKEFNFTEITKKSIPFFDLLGKVDVTEKDALKFFDFDLYKEFAQQYLSENDIKKLKKLQEERIKKVLEIRKFKDTVPQLPDVTPRVTLSPLSREMAISREEMIKDFENTKIILDEVFFAPLSDLFQNFFDTGKFAFEDFGKSILNTIKSLVSKILATGIINLLANVLFPGGGIASAAFGGAATGAGGGILGAFGAAFKSVLGIGKIANPNFGGVQGGGMQLAGEVVFRQRGSDLIGVINRTNGTINRVG